MRLGIKPATSWFLVRFVSTVPQWELHIVCRLFFFFFVFLPFLGLLQRHVEVPMLGIEVELQLAATATAMPDPSCICDLHYSLWQLRILNPLSKARNQTCNLMVPSQIRYHCTMTGTPSVLLN